jgi:hypothetical protein
LKKSMDNNITFFSPMSKKNSSFIIRDPLKTNHSFLSTDPSLKEKTVKYIVNPSENQTKSNLLPVKSNDTSYSNIKKWTKSNTVNSKIIPIIPIRSVSKNHKLRTTIKDKTKFQHFINMFKNLKRDNVKLSQVNVSSHNFKEPVNLNKYLIRNHQIDINKPTVNKTKIAQTNIKFNMTTDLYDKIREEKIKVQKKNMEKYEIEKYGEKIVQVDLDEYKNEEQSKSIKRKQTLRRERKRLTKLDTFLDQFRNNELKEVEYVPEKEIINFDNLREVIHMRNLTKNKGEEIDFLDIKDIKQFKQDIIETGNEVVRKLRIFSRPNFIKTKFRNGTMQKLNQVNGKYFGCLV